MRCEDIPIPSAWESDAFSIHKVPQVLIVAVIEPWENGCVVVSTKAAQGEQV
jgi:hypothetical protein